MNKLELGGIIAGVFVLVFTLGFYTNYKISNQDQKAQLFSSIKKTDVQTVQVQNRITPPSNTPATQNQNVWRQFRDNGGQFYTELPQSSIQNILRFCGELKENIGQNQSGTAKAAFQALNGKYYCINSNGTAGEMCGNGTSSGCRAAGCCGSCIGGVFPPGVTDITQLPGIFFIPDRIIQAIQNRN